MPTGSHTTDDQGKLLTGIEETLSEQLKLIAAGDTPGAQQLMPKLSGLLASYDHANAQVHAAQWKRVRKLYRTVVATMACEFENTKKELSRLTQRRGKVAMYYRGQRNFL